MNTNVIIPEVDALPLPGPVWLFQLLLHLTFVCHLLAMNFVLGGAMIALVERSRRGANELTRWFETRIPAAIALTVTLGVAPLLFVQALYGHLFYSSSVLMAWPWFLVIPVLIASYYSSYLLSFRGAALTTGSRVASWILLVGLVVIAFVYVNNMTLAIRPESWAAKYFESARGWHLNLSDPTFVPRFLHMVVAAAAVAGMMLAWVGARRMAGGAEGGDRMYRTGARWFLIPTVTQFLFGLWFLMALPREIMLQFMGGSVVGTTLLAASIILPLFMIFHQGTNLRSNNPLKATSINAALLLATVVSMVLARDLVRREFLRPHFELSMLQVQPQFGVFTLFAALLVMGIAITAWMIHAFVSAPRDRG